MERTGGQKGVVVNGKFKEEQIEEDPEKEGDEQKNGGKEGDV